MGDSFALVVFSFASLRNRPRSPVGGMLLIGVIRELSPEPAKRPTANHISSISYHGTRAGTLFGGFTGLYRYRPFGFWFSLLDRVIRQGFQQGTSVRISSVVFGRNFRRGFREGFRKETADFLPREADQTF